MASGKGRPGIVVAREREVEALGLRKAGMTYDAIGKKLGVSDEAARKAVLRALARLPVIENAEELRSLELARCDDLQYAVWDRAMRGQVAATDRVLKVMERRA